MSNNAHDLSNRLLNALDNHYNVVDMHTVNEIISILEKINITKELLETTRLGKHVNELRRKTSDPTLARRAKVLVKRWRDLVIPTRVDSISGGIHSPAPRRLAGTPLTSPALSRQVVSPAVSSPHPPARPAWGGYESDSQDVIILVDDDPPPAPPAPAPAPLETANAAKRPASPLSLHDDKKSKRDKKLKKRRGHSRAGSGTETSPAAPPGPPVPPPVAPPIAPPLGTPWPVNGSVEGRGRRRNGCRKAAVDPYTALVNKIPAAGGKKVKTTRELLEQIQSRAAGGAAAGDDDDVVLVEDVLPAIKLDSPQQCNGSAEPASIPASPSPPPEPLPPLEDERLRPDCCCGDEPDDGCAAALTTEIRPFHVVALHNAFLPGINGTRAPPHPHQFAVRKVTDPDQPDLFTSVVPLYKYSDYADDYCVKNMSRVPLCEYLPWNEFAPSPPELPPPKSPPPIRPYPVDEVKMEMDEPQSEISQDSVVQSEVETDYKCKIEPEMVNLPHFEPTDRLKAPIMFNEDAKDFGLDVKPVLQVITQFKKEQQDHRTVEKTKDVPDSDNGSFINKVNLDGRTLYALCEKALESVPYNYCQTSSAPTVTLPENVDEGPKVLESALDAVAADREVDTLGRPPRPTNFTEWHECAKLGSLIALPYVVID